MKKIWMFMLLGIMLLIAKSNNVYAEIYETDLSQYSRQHLKQIQMKNASMKLWKVEHFIMDMQLQ